MLTPQKSHSRKEEITQDFLRLVDEHITNLMNGKTQHRYTASNFAAMLFINPRHLTNTLKLTTGKSPCDFMEERILAEAQHLLKNTNLPIAEISYKFGYEEPTNFTKFFKAMTGITPFHYRKSIPLTLPEQNLKG